MPSSHDGRYAPLPRSPGVTRVETFVLLLALALIASTWLVYKLVAALERRR